MLTSEQEQTIKDLWNRFWSAGIANPLSAIEQISYLIFLKRLEELDDARMIQAESLGEGSDFVSWFHDCNNCRWSTIKAENNPEKKLEMVRDDAFPFMKNLPTGDAFSKAMQDAVFIIQKPSLIESAIEIIDRLLHNDENFDTSGDIYEELLFQLNLAGKNGQFRTPRHIIDVMVEIADPQVGELICDPAAGTAGFLVSAYRWVKSQLAVDKAGSTDIPVTPIDMHFIGYDFDTTMVRLGLMNMLLHGIIHPQFFYQDTLSGNFRTSRPFDVVLANPPFTGNLDTRDLNITLRLAALTTKTELLFVERCLTLLSNEGEGRCCIIVPEGVLFGSTRAHKELRRRLVDENQVEAVISLPNGVFKPYAGVKTSILFFRRGITTEQVWFYEVTGDGYTLDDRRQLDPAHNDLRFVPQAFRKLVRGEPEEWECSEARDTVMERSWWATYDQIVQRDYNLTAGLYRPYTDRDVEYQDPQLIIRRIQGLESIITRKLNELEMRLNEFNDA